MAPARWLAGAGIVIASVACEPARTTGPPSHGAPTRAPTFASRRSQPVYEAAVSGMRAIDALRGSRMTEALATDLGFKCADLKQLAKKLEAEPDPVIWRLRTDIDKTCRFDVPLATALLEIDRMQKKRAADATADVVVECRALKLAIADLGASYIANPQASDVIAKDLTYCGSGDTVRRVP